MSEIFEALLKAQREAEARSGAPDQTPEPPAVASIGDSDGHGDKRRVDSKAAGTRSRAFRWIPRIQLMRNGHHRNGRGQEEEIPWLIAPHHRSVVAEQFRLLRTRIEMVGPSTLMITSALDQEGKTLCAVNLAVALAMGIGAGVILIDADLRRPAAGALFGSHGRAGLLECLTGEARWQDCLMPTSYEGLRVLPAGAHTALAAELLGSEQMRVIIAELRAEFPQHRILVDTPPILLTADPLVVARHMDHILLVVRAGVTPRRAVSQAIEALGADRFLGVVLNDATDNASDHYYYSGRYSYGGSTPTDSD
jgi:capsular exopolysaccharide synthesis family protein